MNEGWSFCIITAPGNEGILIECINQIQVEFSETENYEIIVVGNPVLNNINSFKKTKFIPFQENIFHLNLSVSSLKKAVKQISIKPFFYRTGAICHKKNLAAKHAKYDTLCIMHDYIGLTPGWKKGFDNFSDSWDVCMNIVLNKNGTRHRDWMAWDHPKLENTLSKINPCLIPYNKYTKYMYVSGAYFCVKTSFYLDNPLDEKIFWGEGEDVEWSMRVRELTRFKMNENSTVKYLKLKGIKDAPNCPNWIENRKKMEVILNMPENDHS